MDFFRNLADKWNVFWGKCSPVLRTIGSVFAAIGTLPSLILLYPVSWFLTAIAETIYFIHIYRRAVKNM